MASISSRRLTLVGVLTAALGLVALFWQLRGVSPREIWEGVYRVRWGFPAILALGGLRFALRAYAWTWCVEPPARLAPGDAFAAVLAGDAVGNLTPLGPIVSEPAKAAFVRGRVDLGAAITALAIENLYYTLSVAAMIAAGTIALLFSFDVGPDVRYTSEAALVIIFAMFAIVAAVLWWRPAVISRALGIFARSGAAFAPPQRLDRLRRLEDEIYSFGSRRRDVLARVVAAEIAFHALGVVEIFLTVWLLLGSTPSLLHAFVLEGANRLITVVFKFVPLRVGVDEAGTEWLTQLLGYGPGLGVTLALVRKVRMIAWSVAGSALLVHRGLSTRRILDDSQLARARDI